MTGWTVLLRGARHRAGRSLVVLVLAVIATAAAVLTPAYTRAAQQSVLTDTLRSAPATGTSLTISADGTGDGPELSPAGDSQQVVDSFINAHPLLKSLVSRPVTAVETETEILSAGASGKPGGPGEKVVGRYVYRDRLCAQMKIVGECPIDSDQIIVSTRAAASRGWEVGEFLTITLGKAPVRREIVGTYTPNDPNADYWGINSYFSETGYVHPETGVSRTDSIFAGSEEDIKAWPGFSGTPSAGGAPRIGMSLRYSMNVDRVRLDDIEPLRRDIGNLSLALAGADLKLNTSMNRLLDEVAIDQEAISTTVPLVAVPLVLLAFFVLMLLVASLAEERGPEIALAKLRGYSAGRAARFGQGEVLALIVLATPLGIAAGLGIAEGAARWFLAEGTAVELRWEPFAAGAAALVVSFLAVWAASRRTVRANVLGLLRRVPQRTSWRTGALEGVAVALASAALFAALRERGSLLALLAAPLLAVVAGIVIARLLRIIAGARLAMARRTGNIATLLANAQLARRPGRHRVVTVMTVAVALLGFAATAWDVAAQARQAHAENVVGAARVYSVAAANPEALVAAVHTVAPDGTAMPVVRRSEQYANSRIQVIGVPASQFPDVAQWPGHTRDELVALAAKLHPPAPDPVPVSGVLTIRADVDELGTVPLRLGAVVLEPGKPPRPVMLGMLKRGVRDYSAAVPTGRFVGLELLRPPGSSATANVSIKVTSLSSGAGTGAVRFGDAAAWRFAQERSNGWTLKLGNDSGLVLDGESNSFADLHVDYLDTPAALPMVMAGSVPVDRPGDTQLSFPAFAELPQRFEVVGTAPTIPRAGDHAMLVDLDYGLQLAANGSGYADDTTLFFEVWTTAGAPDLRAAFAEAGVRVIRTETVDGYADQLTRRAPALGLRLYLLAGAVAVLLAFGVVLLVTRIGADGRRMEMAALRVAGVRPRVLRRGLRREYLSLLGLPVLLGFAVGVGSAWLMLPGIAMVTVGEFADPSWHPAVGALAVAAGASLLALLLALIVAVRLLRRSTPDLLRGELR